MATFTITTAQNIDELTGKAGTDTYNIDGGTLTIDQNSYFGQNGATGSLGVLGNITISASLGGTVEIDARYVRAIPYDGGSGNVPAYNTVISGGGASGKMIGVVATMQSTPTAVGVAMPATGFILVKQWNGVAYADNTALSGITATVNGTDDVAPLHIVGNEATARAITCTRLGKFRARGTWMYLGTTSGVNSTTYSMPTYGLANLVYPGVWVETGSGTDVYEFYPSDRRSASANLLGTEEARGKFIYPADTTAANVFRFGSDGTNTNGYTPPAGRKIRIPNLFLLDTVGTVLTLTGTAGTRPEFVTTGGGDVEFDKVVCHWYMNFAQAYAIKLDNVATELIVLSECATAIEWTNVVTGALTATVQTPLTMSLDFAGGTLTDCTFSKYSLGATSYVSMTDCEGFTFTNGKYTCPAVRSGAAVPIALTRVKNSTFENSTVVGGPITMTTCDGITITGHKYIDRSIYSVTSNNAVYAFNVATNTTNVKIDGFTLPVANNGPYSGLIGILAAGCSKIKIRNIGTYASPLDCGVGSVAQYSWTRSTSTATVTWTAHGMVAGDAFYVVSSSSTGAITNVTTYTVASAGTADTFTFTCTNGGATSGTMTAYRTSCAGLGVFTAGAAGNDIRIQRVYLKNTRRILTSPDNSFKNIRFENVDLEEITAGALTALDLKVNDVYARHGVGAGAAVYGSHWSFGKLSEAASQTTASWSRTTTTATFTVTGHGLLPGDEILITNSNSTAAIPNGRYAITTLGTTNTFTITCVNAGNATGTADYTVVKGRIVVMMNEQTAASAGTYTLDVGAPKFTSAGTLVVPAVNDQITWATPDWIYNFNGFPIHGPIFSGTNITLSSHEAYYALDTGSGYGSFKQLMFPRAGGGGSNGSTNITMTDTTGVVVGTYIFGTNVAYGAKVQSITNGTTIVATIANIGTVSGILRFSDLPNETVSATGFKMKVRLKTVAAAATTSFSSIQINALPSGSNEYVLDQNTVTFTGLPTGCDAVVLTAGTSTILDQQDSMAGTTYAYTYSGDQTVDIGFIKAGYVPFYIRNLSLTTADSSIPVALTVDRNYQ
ncbi:MAG TPA: hypothetical protein P5153_17215 [Candidatus Krumholzibacteria bacterium]|nr:hypothetical protein [Candidatus Krumholzibacteria bacterium]